jgi:hypothetical protein
MIQRAVGGRVCLLQPPDYFGGAGGFGADHSVQAKKQRTKMQMTVGLVRI